jgi:Xaa-Pro aminopeptidase
VAQSRLSKEQWNRKDFSSSGRKSFVSPEYLETTKGSMSLAYPVGLDELEFERRARVVAFLEANDLDAIVAFGGGAPGQKAIVRYLTNYSPTGRQVCVIATRSGEITLAVEYSAHFAWAIHLTWADRIELVGSVSEITGELARVTSPRSRVGLARTDVIASGIEAGLAQWLGKNVASASDVTDQLGQLVTRKSALEIGLVDAAGHLAALRLEHARRLARPGISERELVGEISSVLWSGGAEAVALLVASGGGLARPYGLPQVFKADDGVQISVELAGPGGYWVQGVRTLLIGEGLRGLAELVDAAEIVERTLADLLRPGVAIKRMSEVPVPLDGTDAVPLWHGIGLEMGEPPNYLDPGDGQWEAGMVIAIHPNIFKPPVGCFLGNTYVVTDSGARCITDLSASVTDLSATNMDRSES